MVVIETNRTGPLQQVPWSTCAVVLASPEGSEEAPSLRRLLSLGMLCSPSWEAAAEASVGEGGGYVF